MRKLLIIISLISSNAVTLAQKNLVPNGDFEEYWSIPDGLLKESDLSQHLLSWLSPTAGSPDYIHYNSTNAENSVPYQIFKVNSTDYYRNHQLPQSGRGFVGCAAAISSFYERGLISESIQTKLRSKLIKNHKYALEFYTARLGYSDITLHTVGVKLTLDSIRNHLPFDHPQYSNFDSVYIAEYYVDSITYNDTNWHKNKSILKSNGGEGWLTFGNFSRKIDYIKYLGKPGVLGTYFFIDNISLIETPCIVGPDTVCEGDQVKLYSTFSDKFEWSYYSDFSKVFSTDSVVITFADTTKKIFLKSLSGIDSLLIHIIPKSHFETSVVSCFNYTSPSGKTYSSSGTYYDTILNKLGCDSIITTHFTQEEANASISLNDKTLYATDTLNVTKYRWSPCNQDSVILSNTDNGQFTPETEGWYSLTVKQNNCWNTSECIFVKFPSLSDYISIRPNPTFGNLNIILGYPFDEISYKLYNSIGEKIEEKTYNDVKSFSINMAQYASGVYLIKVYDQNEEITERVINIH